MSKNILHDHEQLQAITSDVFVELGRQRSKWGPQNHAPEIWMMILGEETGEAQKAALEAWAANSDLAKGLNHQALRNELIQVAAVAMSIVASLDRNELVKP